MSVFADYNATTPCSREHLAKLCSMLEACDGNPSSIHHFGRTAKVAMEQSRRAISQLLGAKHFQVLFTSGATESNNLWLQGAVAALSPEGLPVVVISASDMRLCINVPWR
jgi:cysteine desulfurase